MGFETKYMESLYSSREKTTLALVTKTVEEVVHYFTQGI